MVLNWKSISQEMPDSMPFNSDKDNGPEEEANGMVCFFLMVHGSIYPNAAERFVKGIKGVESVKCDGSSKLEVMGKVRPNKIQEMVKHETKKEVELTFPSIEMKGDRDKNKGTPGKFMSQVMPTPENDIADEKIGESIIKLKIKLCCGSCNKNLQKILKTKGLEMLNIDTERDLVTIRGTVDMTELGSYIKDQLKKDIEVVNVGKVMASTKKDNAVLDKGRDAGTVDKKFKGKSGGNRREDGGGSVVKSTVVLKIRLDCDGCIEKIRKAISNCRGVETVSVNVDEDLVTVEGTIGVQELTSYLKKEKKIKSNVEVVSVNKKEKKVDQEKKDKYSIRL